MAQIRSSTCQLPNIGNAQVNYVKEERQQVLQIRKYRRELSPCAEECSVPRVRRRRHLTLRAQPVNCRVASTTASRKRSVGIRNFRKKRDEYSPIPGLAQRQHRLKDVKRMDDLRIVITTYSWIIMMWLLTSKASRVWYRIRRCAACVTVQVFVWCKWTFDLLHVFERDEAPVTAAVSSTDLCLLLFECFLERVSLRFGFYQQFTTPRGFFFNWTRNHFSPWRTRLQKIYRCHVGSGNNFQSSALNLR